MANSDVVTQILTTTQNMLTYMLPVIAILAGINFILGFLIHVTFTQTRKLFRG